MKERKNQGKGMGEKNIEWVNKNETEERRDGQNEKGKKEEEGEEGEGEENEREDWREEERKYEMN